MATGTPTESDSYWLSQSTVFKGRVQTALATYLNTVEGEVPTGVTGTMPNSVHFARMNFVKTVNNPANFLSWLSQFAISAAADANVIAAATQSATNYTPITSAATGDTAAADGQSPNLTATLISNAVAACFNTFVPGI